jgi:hypothetical protein
MTIKNPSSDDMDIWEEDDRNVISKSAPVSSNRIRQLPQKPTIKPQAANLQELPDIELPPSYSEPVTMLSPDSIRSNTISRSLQQYAMSCPPNLHSTPFSQGVASSQLSNTAVVGTRNRKDSILDMLSTGSLLPTPALIQPTQPEVDVVQQESDEELPFS